MIQITPLPVSLSHLGTLHTTILALPLPTGVAYAKRSEASVAGAKAADTVIHAVKGTIDEERL